MSWLTILAALAGWFALSVPVGLIVGRFARFGSSADAHLPPHSTGPGTPKPGSVHPLDADWRFPPRAPRDREMP